MRLIIAAVVMSLAAPPSVLAASLEVARYLQGAAEESTYELAIAKIAQEHATRADLRAYAGSIINEQENYSHALRSLAQSKGISLRSSLPRHRQTTLEQLRTLRAAAFDREFIREARHVNAEDLARSGPEASRLEDDDVKAFVAKFRPVQEDQEKRARALAGRAFASRSFVVRPPPTKTVMPVIPPAPTGTMPVINPGELPAH